MPLDDIDFPNPLTSPFTDDNGYTWDWSGTTWERRTKGFIGEAPIDSTPYVRIDAGWQLGMFSDPGAADVIYARKNGGWIEVIDAGTGITDAPSDSVFYGRKNAAWVEPTIADMPVIQAELDAKAPIAHTHPLADITDNGSMAAVDDAPVDASLYARKDGAWVPITPASGIIFNESVTIINPQDTDDATLFFSQAAITVAKLHAHIEGTTSATVNIRFAATRSAAGTQIFNADKVISSVDGVSHVPDTAQIPANSWIWLDITSVADTPEMFHATLAFTQD